MPASGEKRPPVQPSDVSIRQIRTDAIQATARVRAVFGPPRYRTEIISPLRSAATISPASRPGLRGRWPRFDKTCAETASCRSPR
jgi:hypothetical protein